MSNKSFIHFLSKFFGLYLMNFQSSAYIAFDELYFEKSSITYLSMLKIIIWRKNKEKPGDQLTLILDTLA